MVGDDSNNDDTNQANGVEGAEGADDNLCHIPAFRSGHASVFRGSFSSVLAVRLRMEQLERVGIIGVVSTDGGVHGRTCP